jgi:RNA recognition motif-containing protein
MEMYVGGIPVTMRQRELHEIFEKYGKVLSVKIVMDYLTKQNKGYGFVNMPDSNQGLAAIKALNGVMIDGKPLQVNETKFRKDEGRSASADEKPAKPAFKPRGELPKGGSNNQFDEKRGSYRNPATNKDWKSKKSGGFGKGGNFGKGRKDS